jgi:hypothetical protein
VLPNSGNNYDKADSLTDFYAFRSHSDRLIATSSIDIYHWAVIASLIESCKLLGVEPHRYLADVITRIVNGHPQPRLDELMPWVYPLMSQLQVVA